MPEAPLTPEEKLLRIIESPPQNVRPLRPARSILDFKFSLKLLKTKYTEKLKSLASLKTANMVLLVLSVAVTLFLGIDFWMGLPRASAWTHLEAMAKKQGVGDLRIENLEPISIYLQEITQRNIFALLTPARQDVLQNPVSDLIIGDLKENLRVVGIIWSDAPQVMIEDVKDARTYLLNRGGKIKEARVKEILKDRVILSYDNQEIELK